jgi:hypothetical protein
MEVMQLIILCCEAQAAQGRLRNPFRESGKPNQELTLSPQRNEGTSGPIHYLSAQPVCAAYRSKERPDSSAKKQSIKTNITLDPSNYLRLTLIVPAIMLSGLTSCSTADPTVRHNTKANIETAPPAYNSDRLGFEGSWPFGPEGDD